MTLSNESLNKALITSIVLNALLYLIGRYWVFGEGFAQKAGFPSTTKWTKRSTFKPALSFPLTYLWPKFIFLTVLCFPTIVLVVAAILLNEDNEAVLFNLSSSLPSSSETAINLLLWLSVYFLSCLSFSTLLFTLQSLELYFEHDSLFKKLPLQYNEAFYDLFGVLALISFLAATFLAFNVKDSFGEEATSLKELLQASLCFVWAAAFRISFKGFIVLFEAFYFGTIPGVKSAWWLFHVSGGVFVLTKLGQLNETARVVLEVSFLLFTVCPLSLWLLLFRTVQLPIAPGTRSSQRQTWIEDPIAETFGVQFTVAGLNSKLGTTHWLYSWRHPLSFPISSVIVQTPTELDASSKFLSSITLREPMFVDLQNWPLLRPFLTPFLLPFILLALGTHVLMAVKGELLKLIQDNEGVKVVQISPPIGRNVSTLLGAFTCCVFVVDDPGSVVSVGYFCRFVSNVAQGERTQRSKFVFKIKTVFELARLLGSLQLCLAEDKGESLREYLTGGAIELLILFEGCLNNKSFFLKSCGRFSDYIYDALGEDLDLSKVAGNEEQKDIALVSIGSSKLACECYLSKNSSASTKKIAFFDIICEDSPFRAPIQTDPF